MIYLSGKRRNQMRLIVFDTEIQIFCTSNNKYNAKHDLNNKPIANIHIKYKLHFPLNGLLTPPQACRKK